MMLDPLPLFEMARLEQAVETQRAAHRASRAPATGQRKRVLDFLLSRGRAGATDEDIQAALGMRTSSETARRRELVLTGLAVDSGRTRAGSAGRMVTVWRAAEGSQ